MNIIGADEIAAILTKRGWTEVSHEDKAAEAAKSIGIHYALFVTIIEVIDSVQKGEKAERVAYESFTEDILNPYTGTYSYISKFKKVTYEDSYQARILRYDASYSLISSADGKSLVSDKLEVEKKDELHRYIYKGNSNNLYKDPPKDNVLPAVDYEWRAGFNQTRTRLIDKDMLARELNRDLAHKINLGVNRYLK